MRIEAESWSIQPKKQNQPHQPRPKSRTKTSHSTRIERRAAMVVGKIISFLMISGGTINGMVMGQTGTFPAVFAA